MSPAALKPAIFLDRDGVIVENRADYVKSIDEVHILPGALEGLAQAARLDCRIVVVTNQSVVGRGLLTEPALLAIDALYRCGHRRGRRAHGRLVLLPALPEADCACRKPKPGMPLRRRRLEHRFACLGNAGDALLGCGAARATGTRPSWSAPGWVTNIPPI